MQTNNEMNTNDIPNLVTADMITIIDSAYEIADKINTLHRERMMEALAACRPQLRPIAEMPKEVPEGCVRVSGFFKVGEWSVSNFPWENDTHFVDIALPADTYPPEFESAWENAGKPEPKSAAFALWKGGER